MNNQPLSKTIRTCVGILYGMVTASLVVTYVLGFLGMIFGVLFEGGSANETLNGLALAFLGAIVALIPLVIALTVVTLVYTLVLGFAQMMDDTRDMRNHLLGDEKADEPAPMPQKKPVPKPKPKPTPKPTPKLTTIKLDDEPVEAEQGNLFCPYCGQLTFLDENDCCEKCGHDVFIKVTERKKPTTVKREDDEPSEAACPSDKWFCKGCGEYVPNSKTRCDCGYKRK